MINFEPNTILTQDQLTAIRRELHQIPELGLQEYKTAALVEATLHSFGVTQTKRYLETGIVARIPAVNPHPDVPIIAFRADMDALPVLETEKPYASRHTGRMHACGHDGHMTMVLGLAKYLMHHRASLKNDVVVLFQPAEESPGGAQLMIEAGVLEDYHISCIIGCHIFPQLAQGKIGCRSGAMMARNGEVDVKITGKSAHGAQPQLGADALLATGAVISGLHSIISRNLSPLDNALLTFGRIQGGDACNILAREVLLEGTMRAFRDSAYDTMAKRISLLAENIAAGYGCHADVTFRHMYRVVDNDASFTEALATVAGDAYETCPPFMLAEDFSMYQQHIPGLFFFLGSGNPEKGFVAPLHSADFDFDEAILLCGVKTYVDLLSILTDTFISR